MASCLMRIPGAAVVAAVVTKTGGWGLPDTFEIEHPNGHPYRHDDIRMLSVTDPSSSCRRLRDFRIFLEEKDSNGQAS